MIYPCPSCRKRTEHRLSSPAARNGWDRVQCQRCNCAHYVPRNEVIGEPKPSRRDDARA